MFVGLSDFRAKQCFSKLVHIFWDPLYNNEIVRFFVTEESPTHNLLCRYGLINPKNLGNLHSYYSLDWESD